jgi:hypothetical protein
MKVVLLDLKKILNSMKIESTFTELTSVQSLKSEIETILSQL